MVQTEAGLAPADQAELRRAVALGTQPLTDAAGPGAVVWKPGL